MVIVAIYGWARGNPEKYLSGVDDDGKFCGYDDGYGDYEKLYFPDMSSTSAIRSKYVCIKGSCPTVNSGTILCKTTDEVPDCNIFQRYNSKSYLGKYCLPIEDELPAGLKDTYDDLVDWLQLDTIANWISDIITAWPILIIGLFLTLILCLLFMYLVEYFAAILAWICILGSFIFLVALGFFFWFTKDQDDSGESNNETYNIIWACLCWAGALAIFLFVC